MQKQENVYAIDSSAEQGNKGEATAARALVEQQEGSAALGKFKDVDALMQAYKSLQAEFTRRSQRLKRLEMEAEKREAGAETPCGGEGNSPATNAERPVPPMEESIETMGVSEPNTGDGAAECDVGSEEGVQAGRETDAGKCVTPPSEGAEELPLQEAAQADGDERALEGGATAAEGVELQNNAESAETLYQRASANESVRLRIVGDYLSSIQRGGAPLMTGAAGAQPIELAKAESISQAGQRALIWLREKGKQK